jgi:hypothetical protein
MRSAMASCAWLTGVLAALWLVLAVPAYWIAGIDGLEGLSYSALLCLVPGWLVFFLVGRYRVANKQAFAALGGTALRLVFVLVGMTAIQSARTNLGFKEFLVWLILFYLASLFTETLLVIRESSSSCCLSDRD